MIKLFKKSVIGLNLEDTVLKIAQVQKKGNDFIISSFVSKNIPEGVIENGEIKQEDKLITLIKSALVEPMGNSFQGREVVCDLPEEKVFIRIIQLPNMPEEELEQAIKWEAEAHIPLSINEVYLDWHIIESVGKAGDKAKTGNLDILIAAVPKEIADSYFNLLKKSGLFPVALEPKSIAMVRSLLENNSVKPTIIVDIGNTGGTNFIIFANKAIRFTSYVAISDRLFTEALMKEFNIDEKKASLLKKEIGLNVKIKKLTKSRDLTMSRKLTYNTLKQVADKLASQIQEYILFFRDYDVSAGGSGTDIAQIILCGNISVLHLSEYLSQKLGLPVILDGCAKNIVISNKLKNAFKSKYKEKFSACAVVIGLALRSLYND